VRAENRGESRSGKQPTKGKKKDTMKRNILSSIAVVCGLAALFAVTLRATATEAQTALNQTTRIEGLWDSNVTIQDCNTGTVLATFRGLGLFIRGGALEQTNNLPPILGKAALGQWQHLGGSHYSAQFQFYRYDATGVWLGTQKVTRDIQLAPGGASFTGVIASTVLDVNDNVIGTGCGVEAATRVVD
jgi:hypothetical protein